LVYLLVHPIGLSRIELSICLALCPFLLVRHKFLMASFIWDAPAPTLVDLTPLLSFSNNFPFLVLLSELEVLPSSLSLYSS